jgi:hypothetical protein
VAGALIPVPDVVLLADADAEATVRTASFYEEDTRRELRERARGETITRLCQQVLEKLAAAG